MNFGSKLLMQSNYDYDAGGGDVHGGEAGTDFYFL